MRAIEKTLRSLRAWKKETDRKNESDAEKN
jgi:hypothetical protein